MQSSTDLDYFNLPPLDSSATGGGDDLPESQEKERVGSRKESSSSHGATDSSRQADVESNDAPAQRDTPGGDSGHKTPSKKATAQGGASVSQLVTKKGMYVVSLVVLCVIAYVAWSASNKPHRLPDLQIAGIGDKTLDGTVSAVAKKPAQDDFARGPAPASPLPSPPPSRQEMALTSAITSDITSVAQQQKTLAIQVTAMNGRMNTLQTAMVQLSAKIDAIDTAKLRSGAQPTDKPARYNRKGGKRGFATSVKHVVETMHGIAPTPIAVKTHTDTPRRPLDAVVRDFDGAEFHVNTIGRGVAWLQSGSAIQIVQPGDRVGSVRVLSIDPVARRVITSNGIIR